MHLTNNEPSYSDLLASDAKAEDVGAPEIEVTYDMAKAGAELIWKYFYDAMVYGDPSALELAKEVYLAMSHLSFSDETK